jgi:hypothetical protein
MLGTILAVLALESTASAQGGAKNNAVQQAGKAGIVEALKSAHALLSVADRDYDGHRARAAEEVEKALRELGHHHHHHKGTLAMAPAAVPHAARTGEAGHHEVQSTSDTQLQQARSILQGVAGQIGGRHAKAQSRVNAAIAEIGTALNIR